MLEVYFHVGLGKTGTKYLQFKFFHRLKGINYIPMTKFKKSKDIIKKKKEGKFLVSRECDEKFEEMIGWFAEDFPDTGIIMVLRRQDEWIYSQFKRLIKNGRTWTFNEFFNFKDKGYFKVKDLCFFEKIKLVERTFTKKPLILIYDELKERPFDFLDKIAKYTETKYDKGTITLKRKHKSYNERQLSILYKLSCHINLIPRGFFKKYFFVYPVRYPILYLAGFFPNFIVQRLDIFPSREKLMEIKKFYEEDWNKCVEYSRVSLEDQRSS